MKQHDCKVLTIAAALAVAIFASASQFNVSIENDALKVPSSDDDYTHGTGFEYVTDSFMHFKLG